MICSDDQLNEEIELILKIAFDHGFPAKYIDKIIQKYNTPPPSGQQQDNNQLVVYRKYHYNPTIFEKLEKIIQKYNIKLVAIPPPYLIDIVSDKIDRTPMDQKSGIYEILITFSNNENVYIRMTKRKLSVRIMEHRRDIMQRKTALS